MGVQVGRLLLWQQAVLRTHLLSPTGTYSSAVATGGTELWFIADSGRRLH